METDYIKLEEKPLPQFQERTTAENRMWNKFKTIHEEKLHSPIVSVEYSPIAPYDICLVSGGKVILYPSNGLGKPKTIKYYKEKAYSGHFRCDGELIINGTEDGGIHVHDTRKRVLLRSIKGHTDAVHCCLFSANKLHMFSASDDKSVKHWDLSTKTLLNNYKFNTDYVRTLDVTSLSPSLLLTGSYDSTAKLIDTRMNNSKPVFEVNHENPIESVLFNPNGNLFFTAGGNSVKVWDLNSHGMFQTEFSGHQKTITALHLDSSKNRLLSSSLDGHIKIYDLKTYKITHGYKFNSPILSFNVCNDGLSYCVGTSNNKFIIREKQKHVSNNEDDENNSEESEEENDLFPSTNENQVSSGGVSKFLRGPEVLPEETDEVITQSRKSKLNKWDKFMKSFEYHKALDAVLFTKHTPTIIAVIEELQRRNGLKIALQGRDEITIEPIILFIMKNIINPLYTLLLIHCTNLILDLYAGILGEGSTLDKMIYNLKKRVLYECQFEDKICELKGFIDIISNNT